MVHCRFLHGGRHERLLTPTGSQCPDNRPPRNAVAVFRGPHQADTDIAAKVSALETRLKSIAAEFGTVRLASSLAAEDNVLFDAVARLKLDNISTFSLDTGRLHEETLAVADQLQARYGTTTQWIEPNSGAVAEYVNTHGQNAFYHSVELRKACCHIRKVEPLGRALQGAHAWITGQRAGQAATRTALPEREHDAAHGLVKFNPLSEWSEADIWTYIRQFDVPVNPLHFKGFPSIGCEPCTRAITIGEEIRAGRWWWEDPQLKECGLHQSNLQQSTLKPR
ncbi:MAG: phosphoadenylyl-sulfate reductase [Limnobacter sp.]|nr:phosphoadenylyl-sulfate reductase [Limnobacter sp.]